MQSLMIGRNPHTSSNLPVRGKILFAFIGEKSLPCAPGRSLDATLPKFHRDLGKSRLPNKSLHKEKNLHYN